MGGGRQVRKPQWRMIVSVNGKRKSIHYRWKIKPCLIKLLINFNGVRKREIILANLRNDGLPKARSQPIYPPPPPLSSFYHHYHHSGAGFARPGASSVAPRRRERLILCPPYLSSRWIFLPFPPAHFLLSLARQKINNAHSCCPWTRGGERCTFA